MPIDIANKTTQAFWLGLFYFRDLFIDNPVIN
jgi:hypothetical protein